jgi:hypothetical protein
MTFEFFARRLERCDFSQKFINNGKSLHLHFIIDNQWLIVQILSRRT